MSASSEQTATGRTADFTFEINAPVEDVWAAITEADHLTNWFPLTAEVKPGLGGTMFMAWGDACKGTCTIEVWEPNKLLRTTFMEGPQEGADGPMRTYVDYHLESNGGATTLRLVHSGFGEGAHWDQLYNGVSRGWAAELRSLRHYLENHFGKRRQVMWKQHATTLGDPEVWAKLIGAGCLGLESASGIKQGERYRADGPALGAISGTVLLYDDSGALAGTVDELNKGYLRIEIDHCSGPEASVWFWVSAYDVPEERLDAIESQVETILGALAI